MIVDPQTRGDVQDILLRYCRAVDRCDWDLLRAVYHDDAVIDHGAFQGDVDGFVDFVRSRRVGIVHSAHFVSNMLAEPAGKNRVAMETYGWAVQTFTLPSPSVRSGYRGVRQRSTYRYVDLLEKRAGRWGIIDGHLVLGELEAEDLLDEPRPRDGLTQRPSTEDPVYLLQQRWLTR